MDEILDLPPMQPETVAEMLWYAKYHEWRITLLIDRNGIQRNLPLSELTPKEYGQHLARLIEQGGWPIRTRTVGMP